MLFIKTPPFFLRYFCEVFSIFDVYRLKKKIPLSLEHRSSTARAPIERLSVGFTARAVEQYDITLGDIDDSPSIRYFFKNTVTLWTSR